MRRLIWSTYIVRGKAWVIFTNILQGKTESWNDNNNNNNNNNDNNNKWMNEWRMEGKKEKYLFAKNEKELRTLIQSVRIFRLELEWNLEVKNVTFL